MASFNLPPSPSPAELLAQFSAESMDETEQLRLANSIVDVQKELLPSLPLTYTYSAPSSSSAAAAQQPNANTLHINYCTAAGLPPKMTLKLFQIFEANMKEHYQETWGWDKNERFKELFHPASRYILVTHAPSLAGSVEVPIGTGGEGSSPASATDMDTDTISHTAHTSQTGHTSHSRDTQSLDPSLLAAFLIYRFTWDDEEEPEHPVLYIYELQVSPASQGRGLGLLLTGLAAAIAGALGLWKVMLTCFKRNQQALRFYQSPSLDAHIKQSLSPSLSPSHSNSSSSSSSTKGSVVGFRVDANSPSSCGHAGEDYEILSLAL